MPDSLMLLHLSHSTRISAREMQNDDKTLDYKATLEIPVPAFYSFNSRKKIYLNNQRDPLIGQFCSR